MSENHRNKGLPPLDWLRIFEAAARLGGFSAAAREFGLTQAAVSQRIRSLETWLARELFVRSARGVTLTYAGESYLPIVQESLEALERGTEDLFGKAPRELRIAALSSHLTTLVTPCLSELQNKHPDVRFTTDSVPQRSNFADEKTWLHLRYGRGKWAGREMALICTETLCPMASPSLMHMRWQDMALIELRGERPGWRRWGRKNDMPAPRAASISVDSMEHALVAAANGLGLVLGSKALAAPMLNSGQLVKLDLPALATKDGYWLTWPEDKLTSKKSRALVLALRDALSQSVSGTGHSAATAPLP
ncbi:LysR family transcriptional regulator [Shimia thalassica]|uniref:LysR family transcriptional regulator n=1 Tax=Shimia thalassica TaxID=1715693 RepID=UPI0026E3244D|nr:LysR family transcriptional regulator [Shimia thalassica]MDO6797383.1 LysR family transcriptional regulator [Shimia thalassica]